MKNVKRILGAIAVSGAALLAQGAMAADVSNPDMALDVAGGGSVLGHVFSMGNAGNGFSERYTFSVGAGSTISADVFSFASSATTGLDILGLSLFNADGLVVKGTGSSGTLDHWTLTSNALAAGDYFLLVSGTVLSNGPTFYSGGATVTAVPEPATYGMLLGGLGLVGALARRRKQTDAA
ncbi:FxDxF family PEP-CTERM protein [Duganella callida]|nr:FxDxF family PEP-CTERM protein [Duganella callida]